MDKRWEQRFQNFEKAHKNLLEMLEFLKQDPSNKAYKLAVVQSYEMDIELSWKTLKDYLNYLGFKIQAPREAIKQAFAVELLKDADLWLTMLEDRNITSHVYDELKAQEIVDAIEKKYFFLIDTMFNLLKDKINE